MTYDAFNNTDCVTIEVTRAIGHRTTVGRDQRARGGQYFGSLSLILDKHINSISTKNKSVYHFAREREHLCNHRRWGSDEVQGQREDDEPDESAVDAMTDNAMEASEKDFVVIRAEFVDG